MMRVDAISTLTLAFLSAACMLLIFLQAASVEAQDSGIPAGTPANGVDTGNTNDPPDVVVVAADDCTVSPGASITLEDGDGTQATFTDGDRGVTITAPNGSPRIEGPSGDFIGNHARFPTSDTSFDTDGDYSVVSSTGITCGGEGASPTQVQYAQDQYAQDKTPPAEVDNPKGVVPGTITGKKVPDTGGPPYLAVGALVLLCAAVMVGRGILRR
jgi:hypothetical protein